MNHLCPVKTRYHAAGKVVNQFLLDWGAHVAVGVNIRFIRQAPKTANELLFGYGRRRCHRPPPGSIPKLALAAAGGFRRSTGQKFVFHAHEPLGLGSTGGCWRGVMRRSNGTGEAAATIKLAWEDADEYALRCEAAVYTYLSPCAMGVRRPQFYGSFQGSNKHALVLQYTGESIESFDALSVDEK
jgi:hypothetical protein